MTVEEKKIGRIRAVLSASEEVIGRAKKVNQKDVISIAMETAYEHIKGIIDDVSYCPWQE